MKIKTTTTQQAGPYGTKFNGYMGVCVAWPRDKHEVKEVKVERVVDSVEWVVAADWECPKCHAKCFGSKTHCFKCNTANPDAPPRTASNPMTNNTAAATTTSSTVVATSPLGAFARVFAFMVLMYQGIMSEQNVPVEMAPSSKPKFETWKEV
jgi:hypothetical protein